MRTFYFTTLAGLLLTLAAFAYFYWPLPMMSARDAIGAPQHVERDGRTIQFYVSGEGAPVVMLASLGREASDFNELAASLNEAGYRTIAIEAPGIGGSGAISSPVTLWDLADDVHAVVAAQGGEPVLVIGHAFGNRVARAYATRYGARGVVLLAAGGKVPIAKRARAALLNSFQPWVMRDDRREEIRYAFFAEGTEVPSHWLRGWHYKAAQPQIEATQSVPHEEWWGGGDAPLLVVQAMEDVIAPKEDTSDMLKAEFGPRVEVAFIEQAGHALLPEQPDAIASAVTPFFEGLR